MVKEEGTNNENHSDSILLHRKQNLISLLFLTIDNIDTFCSECTLKSFFYSLQWLSVGVEMFCR